MTCGMHAKDRTAASLCFQEREIAKDDAIVQALANGKRWRDLAVGFNLIAAWGGEVAEVCLPQFAPASVCTTQFTLVEHSAGANWLEPSLHQVVGCGEALGKARHMGSLARQADTVLAKK